MARIGGSLMEVARRCAVSQSTVSRVLNNTKRRGSSVSPEVRERVLRIAAEMNYRPSIAARNLALGKTNLVAILGVRGLNPDRLGPLEEAASAVAQALDLAGYEICLQFGGVRHSPFDLPSLRIDGAVVVAPGRLEDVKALDQAGIPYVSIDGVVGEQGMQVVPDDQTGMRLALEHLYELGHRHIAYLDNPDTGALHPSIFNRRSAFAEVTRDLQVKSPKIKFPGVGLGQPWNPYFRPFLQQAIVEGRATAVVAYSHFGAFELLRAAHDMGLHVPKDFSMVCFNNERVISLCIPSITAIDIPTARMGAAAAELLLHDLKQEKSTRRRSITVEESLVVRESTAPLR